MGLDETTTVEPDLIGGPFRVHVYGGQNIEESEEIHDRLADAVESVERMSTDDHFGWEFLDGRLRLVDNNRSHRPEDVVIHSVEPVEVTDE